MKKRIPNKYDSIGSVCRECGLEANRLTCLKKYGKEPEQEAFSMSTFHKGNCGFCGEERWITEVRDYFYPDFELLEKHNVEKRKNK